MTEPLANFSAVPVKTLSKEKHILHADVPIGAAGAVGTLTGDPGIGCTLAGTGDYDFTFPPCAAVYIEPKVISSAGTVVGAYVTAKSATDGTCSIKTVNGAGADTAPANGDTISIEITGQPYAA